jgi:hypothetical protein
MLQLACRRWSGVLKAVLGPPRADGVSLGDMSSGSPNPLSIRENARLGRPPHIPSQDHLVRRTLAARCRPFNFCSRTTRRNVIDLSFFQVSEDGHDLRQMSRATISMRFGRTPPSLSYQRQAFELIKQGQSSLGPVRHNSGCGHLARGP